MKVMTETLGEGLSFDMIYIEGGSFMMGNDSIDSYDREKPIHKVDIRPFYIGKYQVTQDIWNEIMVFTPFGFSGERRPVERVTWEDTQLFIEYLYDLSGRKYRLPTEAEWEYAAKGGNISEGYEYAGSDKLQEVAWFGENSNGVTHEVGLKMANELGIYDMSGNVYEWVEDQFHVNYEGAPTDGSAWVDLDSQVARVVRGGCYFHDSRDCRVTDRNAEDLSYRDSYYGFRLALSAEAAGRSR